MTPYFELSTAERLALSSEDYRTSVKLEAIKRGITPPIPLPDDLKHVGYHGFSVPADPLKLFEICAPQGYGEAKPTGVAYRTEEAAIAALRGAFSIHSSGYGVNQKDVLSFEQFAVRIKYVGKGAVQTHKVLDNSEISDPSEAFVALGNECQADLDRLSTEAYTARVNTVKRAEYLRLAGGDEVIAAAFWAKVEGGAFPTA